MSFFYNLNALNALLLLYTSGILISLIGFTLCRKYFFRDDQMLVIRVAQQTTLTFGTLFMAFWIAVNWQIMDDLSLATEQEAHAVASLYSLTRIIPNQVEENKVRNATLNYLNTVIDVEYSSLSQGKLSVDSENAFQELVQAVNSYPKITTIQEQFAYAHINASLTTLADNRVKRLDYVNGELDGIMLIFFIGLIIIMCFWVGCIKPYFSMLSLIILLSQNLIITSSAWLVLELDHPFQGEYKVNNAPFVAVKHQLMNK